MRYLIVLLLITGLLHSCSKESDPQIEKEVNQTINLSGHVEKGPFVRGATITAYELTKNLASTGKSYKSELLNNIGEFSFPKIESTADYLELTANGYYFNENSGQLSKSTIALNAIINAKSNSDISVNVLTHLEQKRVKYLINKDVSFQNAKNQARKELFDAFFISGIDNEITSEQITLTKNGKSSTALLGISSLLLKLSDNNDAQLTELLSNLSNDLESDGVFEDKTSEKIAFEIALLDNDSINRNLKKRFSESGLSIADFNFSEVFAPDIINRIQSINLERTELIIMKNEKYPLVYSIFPLTANKDNLIWESSNPSIINVDSNGEITGVSQGDATISVQSSNNPSIKASLKIRVLNNLVFDIQKLSNMSDYQNNGGYYTGKIVLSLNQAKFYDFFSNTSDKNYHSISVNRIDRYENNVFKESKDFTNITLPEVKLSSISVSLNNYFKPQFHFHYTFRGKNYVQIFSDF